MLKAYCLLRKWDRTCHRMMRNMWIIAYICSVAITTEAILHEGGEVKEYCQLELFNASCLENQVIVVTSAQYGRMRIGRCVLRAYGSLGCTTDVLDQLDRLCSGRRQCSFHVSSLHKRHPCPQDLTPFLEASYYCQNVVPGTPEGCMTATSAADVTAPSGYLANYVTLQTGRGSRSCPWRIRAGVGQRINVTLINFARATSRERAVAKTKPHVCYQFAVFREGGHRQTLTECEGGKRLLHVYLTSTNAVQISMLTRSEADFYFMLHYEVVGCADPVVPASMWVKRTGDTAVIKCNATGDSWGLTCTDRYWHGHIGNCTVTGTTSVDWQVGMFNKGNFPYSILIIVAIGVALGVFLGGILLVCVSKYLRSRAARRRQNTLYQSGMYGAAPGQTTSLPEDVAIRPTVPTTYHTERIKPTEIKECKELKTPLGPYGQYPAYAPATGPGQTFLHMYESPKLDKGDGR